MDRRRNDHPPNQQESDMAHRVDDNVSVRIDRSIPLWGLILLGIGLGGNAILLWAGQREQAIKFEALSNDVRVVLSDQKAQTALSNKSSADFIKLEAQVTDLSRRLIRVETRIDAKP